MPSFGAATFWMSGRPPVEPLRSRSVPMLLAALAFAGGILCARQWHGPMAMLFSLCTLLGIFWASLRWAQRTTWLIVLAIWAVVGCWCAQVQKPIDRQVAVHGYADGLSRTVRGRVSTVRSLREVKPVQGAPVQPL
jgi:competence protein ComEC